MTKWLTFPGLSEYNFVLQQMLEIVEEIKSGKRQEDVVMLVEHEDVYTVGSGCKDGEIFGDELIDVGNVSVVYSRRGGKVTYHGPGQRVIYPIINLQQQKDIKLYVRFLEQWMINCLQCFGIRAFTIDGLVGIWVHDIVSNKPAKIGAIGIKVSKWVAYHGIAININNDLSKFSKIIPCGIRDYSVISLSALGLSISMTEFDLILKQEFDKLRNQIM